MDKVILCLCLITMLSNASFSLIAPFYPLEAKKKQIDIMYIGCLMSTQSITFIFSSFITGKLLNIIGRTRGMIIGVLLIIMSILGLGSLKYVHSKTNFILYSFLWKFMCGMGAGLNSTSTMAIITTHYKHDRERTIGLMESSSGVGLLLGPFFGAILYQIGGYVLPFFATSAFYFCLYPLIAFTLAKINEAEKNSPKKEKNPEKEELQIQDLLKINRFKFGLISQIIIYAAITYLQPTMALHLQTYGYNEALIGFCFAVPTLIYASTSPLIFILTNKLRKSLVIMIGYFILVIAAFFIGPSELLGFYNSPSLILLGLCFMGFGCGLIIIPIMPDMIESIEEQEDYEDIDDFELHNLISGLFIGFQGIGETSGPVLGSFTQKFFGFRRSMDIVAITVFFFMILYFWFCGKFNLFLQPYNPNASRITGVEDTLSIENKSPQKLQKITDSAKSIQFDLKHVELNEEQVI